MLIRTQSSNLHQIFCEFLDDFKVIFNSIIGPDDTFINSPCFLLFQASIPFAVVGSNTVVEVNGKKVRGRLYPWGIVEGKTLTFMLLVAKLANSK